MAILYGTQSNGETLPVEVNEFGQLVAKGIEGPPGPEGPPGVGELPPGAFDGAVLGWENGELVWFGSPVPPVPLGGFRPVVYTGNGGSQSIDCGFSPALVWIKNRDSGLSHHILDTVRGASEVICSNNSEEQFNSNESLQAFNSNGFTIGSNLNVNESGSEIVAWCWRAGDTTVTNNEGSIASEVRSNGSFSVVKYTGNGNVADIGHGLGQVPAMVIVKSLDNEYWYVYHQGLDPAPGTKYIRFNLDREATTSNAMWNGTTATSSVFTVGPDGGTCGPNDFIAYAWAETIGISSFSAFQGNGSLNQIVTGFRPSFVMIKSTGSGDWFMFDNARGAGNALYADLSNPEDELGAVEFLDTGFRLLSGLTGINENGETYIYAAFANPEDAAFAQRQLRREVRQEERQQNETPLR